MSLRDFFLDNRSFQYRNNLFYQNATPTSIEFEDAYMSLRQNEARIYSDEIVKMLPNIPHDHQGVREWRARKCSSQKLLKYIAARTDAPNILELGCGNGWLSHLLAATIPNSEVLGVDLNESELEQASRVFKERKNLFFAYADIFTSDLPRGYFDYIIMAASIQYFPEIEDLLDRLCQLTSRGGEIHILDSPLYSESEAINAKKRSEEHFSKSGTPRMGQYYFHHTWNSLRKFPVEVLYNSQSILNKLLISLSLAPPFPWIKLKIKQS